MQLDRITVPPRLGFLNTQMICNELGISPRTARRWTSLGQLPQPRRLGRQAYWSVEELRAALGHKGGAK